MPVRLIFAGQDNEGKLYVDAAVCPCCDHDVWIWYDSVLAADHSILAPHHIGYFQCASCKENASFDEERFLLEATDERDAWFAGRAR
jgi:hypothetical protein